jgi:hypothetical protein
MGELAVEVHRWSTEDLARWDDLGTVPVKSGSEMADAVRTVAQGPGVYRARQVGEDDWGFFYVQEDGQVRDSGARSRIE